jgi:hypothetical protein
MTRTDHASRIVKALEQTVYAECMAKGRLDVLDWIREFGFELRDDGDNLISFMVAGEQVLQVRLTAPLPRELLN